MAGGQASSNGSALTGARSSPAGGGPGSDSSARSRSPESTSPASPADPALAPPTPVGDDTGVTAAAILVALGLILIVRLVWGKANPGAKLAAIGGVLFAIWACLAVASPIAAGVVAAGLASGIVGIIHGIAGLIAALS